jgi:hypothetical protein
VIEASNGRIALEILEGRQGEAVDIILTDNVMPEASPQPSHPTCILVLLYIQRSSGSTDGTGGRGVGGRGGERQIRPVQCNHQTFMGMEGTFIFFKLRMFQACSPGGSDYLPIKKLYFNEFKMAKQPTA